MTTGSIPSSPVPIVANVRRRSWMVQFDTPDMRSSLAFAFENPEMACLWS